MLSPEAAARKDHTTGKATLEHRHFATIATIIGKAEDRYKLAMALRFADELRATNHRFDRNRFLRACGVL